MEYCTQCGEHLEQNYNYCPNCGKTVQGVKSRLSGIGKKMSHSFSNTMNRMKQSLDSKIRRFKRNLEKDHYSIAGYTIPKNRKPAIRKALTNFQSKLDTSHPQTTISYNSWIENLPDVLQAHKCVICYKQIEEVNDVFICPNCETGGHKDHIIDWVADKGSCPFCTDPIGQSDLIKITDKN